MKRALITFSIALLIIFGVFIYAQTYGRREVVFETRAPEQAGQVLGEKDTKKEPTQKTPIKVVINKDPVFLYWPQKITVETTPGIDVRVTTTYPNGTINNSGTKSGVADAKGKFTVSWTIKGKKDILGIAKVEVTVGNLETYSKYETIFAIEEYKKATTNSTTSSPASTSATNSPNSASQKTTDPTTSTKTP